MIVPDASATGLLFADPTTDPRVAEAKQILDHDPRWVVPEHWRAEAFSAIRSLWFRRELDDVQARRAVGTLARMEVTAMPATLLLPRMWELRSKLSAHDAAYVAVAEAYDVTLVTADVRIGKAGVARCPIRTIT